MEFDAITLRPTYRVLWGIPGRSRAMDIAAHLGMDPGVLAAARAKLGEGEERLEDLAARLEAARRQQVEDAAAEAEAERVAAAHAAAERAARARVERRRQALDGTVAAAVAAAAAGARGAVEVRCAVASRPKFYPAFLLLFAHHPVQSR